MKLKIFNLDGKLILDQYMDINFHNEIDLSHLSQASYVLQLFDEKGILVQMEQVI